MTRISDESLTGQIQTAFQLHRAAILTVHAQYDLAEMFTFFHAPLRMGRVFERKHMINDRFRFRYR
jgi:hypothetical protein